MKNMTSNHIVFLLVGVLLISVAPVSTPAQTEKAIGKIRADVAAISKNAPKYTNTTKDIEDISLEGMQATYYLAAKDVKKITAKIYGETYKATGEFYYRDGELIFAFLKHSQYDSQIGLDKAPKVIRVEEQRFYFTSGELIRLLVGKKELKSADERHSQLKQEIINISGKLMRQ